MERAWALWVVWVASMENEQSAKSMLVLDSFRVNKNNPNKFLNKFLKSVHYKLYFFFVLHIGLNAEQDYSSIN